MQLWAFLEEHHLVLVRDLNEHNVNAFRVYLRSAMEAACRAYEQLEQRAIAGRQVLVPEWNKG